MVTKLKAKLLAITQPLDTSLVTTPEELIYYAAKVSNPSGQGDMGNIEGFFNYCMRNKHWSVFEMANAVVEVEAPRDITRQLIRHRSFNFQEFSQRYSDAIEFTDREFRRQDPTNRQNSIDDLPVDTHVSTTCKAQVVTDIANAAYRESLEAGVAKECARVMLPEGLTMSRLYVNGTLRSWMHYLEVRDDPGVTQQEHVDLARLIRAELEPAFPHTLGKKGS